MQCSLLCDPGEVIVNSSVFLPIIRSPRPDAQEKMIETVTGRMGKLTLGGKVSLFTYLDW